jgi:alpha-amylase
VINNSGDNWEYEGGPKNYHNGDQFNFGAFRPGSEPIPTELRDPDWYHRRGQIQNYDTSPENQLGDIVGLKDYANDDTAIGSLVINTIIKAYCFWIREADVDGFRVDAVKHMGALACARFCSNVREYAYSLGKRQFFLFGELAKPDDDIYNSYLGQNTSSADDVTVFFGIDSLLDFRLAESAGQGKEGLRDVIKGFAGPQTLFDRLEAQRNRALNRGEMGRYLVRSWTITTPSGNREGGSGTEPHRNRSSPPSAICCAPWARRSFTTERSRASRARAATTRCARRCSTRRRPGRTC